MFLMLGIKLLMYMCNYVLRWKSMYKIYSKNVDVKHVSHLRKVAIQGLESVRLIGNHGIDVQLMVYLAKNVVSQV